VTNHIDSYMNETLDMVIKLNNTNDIFNTSKLVSVVQETINQLTNIGISSTTISEIKQSLNVSEKKSFDEIFQMINSQSKVENEIKNYILKNNSSLSDFTLNQIENIVNQPKYADYESFSYIKNIIEENNSQSSYQILNEISNFISNFNDEKNQQLVNNLSEVVNTYKSQITNNSQSIISSNVDIKNMLIQELTENNVKGFTYNLATAAYSQNINTTTEELNTILNDISSSSTFNDSNLKQLETIINLSSAEFMNNSMVEELEQNFNTNNFNKNEVKNYIDSKKNEISNYTATHLKSIINVSQNEIDNNIVNYFNSDEVNEQVINEVKNYLLTESNTRSLTLNEQNILSIVQTVVSQNSFLDTVNKLVQYGNMETSTLNVQNMNTLSLAYQAQEILNNPNIKNVFENTATEIKNDVSLNITDIINYEKSEVFNSVKQQVVNIVNSMNEGNTFNVNSLVNANNFNEIKEYFNNNLDISNETKNIISIISNAQIFSNQQIENISNQIFNSFEDEKSEITNILNQIAEYKNINLNDYKTYSNSLIETTSSNTNISNDTSNNTTSNSFASNNTYSNNVYSNNSTSNIFTSNNAYSNTIIENAFAEIQNILSVSSSATSEIIQNLIEETNNKFEYKTAQVIFEIDNQEKNNFNNLVNELISTISNSTNITNNQELLTSLNNSFEKYDLDIDVENTESTQIDSTIILKQIKEIKENLANVTTYSSANETINNFKTNALQEVKSQFSSIFNNRAEYDESKFELVNQLNSVKNFNDLKQFVNNNTSSINTNDIEIINKFVSNQSTVNSIVEKIESIYRLKNIQKLSSNVSKDVTFVEVINYLENNLNNSTLINEITSNLINNRSIADLRNIIINNQSVFSSTQLEQINSIVSKNENYISLINNASSEEQIANILNESKSAVYNFTLDQVASYLQNSSNPVIQNFISKSLQENIDLDTFVTLVNENKKYLTTEDNKVVQNILSSTESITNLFNQGLNVNNFEESVKIATNVSDQKTYIETLNVLSTNEKFENIQNNVNQLFSENKSVLELQTIINSNIDIFNDEEKSTINNIFDQNKKENNLYQNATNIEEIKNFFQTMQSSFIQKSVSEVANYLVSNSSTSRINNVLNTEVLNNSSSIADIKNIIENNIEQISKYDYASLQNILSKNELLQTSYSSIQNINQTNSQNVNNNFASTQNTMLQIVSYLSTVLSEEKAQNILNKISKEEKVFENISSYVQEIKSDLTQEQYINIQNIINKNESLTKYSSSISTNLNVDSSLKYNIENELLSQANQVINNNISSTKNQYVSELKSVLETNVENQTYNIENLISQITTTAYEYSQNAENVVSNLFEAMDVKNYQNVSNEQKQEILNKINTLIQSYNFENMLTNVLNNNVNINQNIVNNQTIKLLTEISNSNLNVARLEANYQNAINNNSTLSSVLNTINPTNNNYNIISNFYGNASNQFYTNIQNNNVSSELNTVNRFSENNNSNNILNTNQSENIDYGDNYETNISNNINQLNVGNNSTSNTLITDQSNLINDVNNYEASNSNTNNQSNLFSENNYSFKTLEQIFAQRISNQFQSAYNYISSINNIKTNNYSVSEKTLNEVRQFIENKNNITLNTINTEINNTASRIENIVNVQNQENNNFAQESLSIIEQNVKNITEVNNLPSNVNKLTTEDNNYINIENNNSSTNTVTISTNEENVDINNLRIEKVWDTYVQKEVSKIIEEVENEKKDSTSVVNNSTTEETYNSYNSSTENKNIYEIKNENNVNESHYHQNTTPQSNNQQTENIVTTKTTNIENINIQEMTETVFSKIEQRFKTYNITHEDMIILKNKILTEVVEIYEKRTSREIELSELRIKQDINRMFKQFLNS